MFFSSRSFFYLIEISQVQGEYFFERSYQAKQHTNYKISQRVISACTWIYKPYEINTPPDSPQNYKNLLRILDLRVVIRL